MSFVHLHLHSEYSLSQSLVKTPLLVEILLQEESPAVAVTDWCNLYGSLNFYKHVNKLSNGKIKTIFGVEIAVKFPNDPIYKHLVLLAKNNNGYKNLQSLVTDSHAIYGLSETGLAPCIPFEKLAKYSQDLICLTAGIKGILNYYIINSHEKVGLENLLSLQKIFKQDLYLELQPIGYSPQKKCNDQLVNWSNKYGVELVATSDVHYLEKQDAYAQEVWMMVGQKVFLQDSPKSPLMPNCYYLQSADEMKEHFAYQPKAIENTLKIAEQCNVEFNFSDKDGNRIYHLPDFNSQDSNSNNIFNQECDQGLKNRLKKLNISDPKQVAEYKQRLDYEISVITKMGFDGYYLIVSDFIRWAKKNLIPVGPGRGSGAGSLVAYCLDITNLDPISNGLLFERFLNPERVSLPDFDIDFCQARRFEVIKYVAEKYGRDRVCQIVTFAKEQSKNAIKDVGRVFGMSFGETNRLSKLIPSIRMKPLTIAETLDSVAEFKQLVINDQRTSQVIDIAQKIEGSLRQPGVHAAGVIIASRDIKELAPMSCDLEGNPITQWDMNMCEEAGLVKFDFLGLVTLDLLDLTCALIKKRSDASDEFSQNLTYENIPVNDPRSYQLIARGDTLGVFQFESSGMQNLCLRIGPSCFEDLCAINALYRPGPLESGMVDDYIARKKGKAKITYMFPEMEECLKETYGTIVYQEQVMEIAKVVAGYSLGQADVLRKAMGKKIASKMAEEKVRFVEGAVKKENNSIQAEELFLLIEKFAGYGFNKSHAAAYVMLSAQTAFLKAAYPTEFFTALLTIDKENTDKLSRYIVDAKKRGIKILPPDINQSISDFSIPQDSVIRFGLSAIKNVGEAAVKSILVSRDNGGEFKDLYDFLTRVDNRKINKRLFECLIQCGAFDSFYINETSDTEVDVSSRSVARAILLANSDQLMEWASKKSEQAASGQESLFSLVSGGEDQAFPKPKMLNGRKIPDREVLAWERELLGIYVSGSPLDRFIDKIQQLNCTQIFNLKDKKAGTEVMVAGLVSEIRELRVKRGKSVGKYMSVLKIEDFTGQVEMVSFPDHYQEFQTHLNSNDPILVRAQLDFEDDRPKLMGSRTNLMGAISVEYLSEVKQKWPKEFNVAVNLSVATDLSQDLIFTQLQKTLKSFPGKTPVTLRLTQPDKFNTKIQLGDEFKIQVNRELESRLTTIVNNPGVISYKTIY